jgi:uncharacterized protein
MPDPAAQAGAPLGAGDADASRTPIFDVHVHLFAPEVIAARDAYVEKDEWFRLLYADPKSRMVPFERVLEEMDRTGVDVSVVFGFAFRDQGLCREANDYVLEAMRAHPGRFVGFACVSPEEPGAVAELERCLEAGMRGAGELFPDGQRFDLRDSSGLDRVAELLTERGLALALHSNEPVGHVYPGKGDNTPGPCFDFARRHPALDIIYAHMGGGLFLYELMPEVRKVLARVHYDTSAVPYLYGPEVYALAATAAGREKILFGSDYPLLSPARYLAETAELEPGLRHAILGANSGRLLGLNAPSE